MVARDIRNGIGIGKQPAAVLRATGQVTGLDARAGRVYDRYRAEFRPRDFPSGCQRVKGGGEGTGGTYWLHPLRRSSSMRLSMRRGGMRRTESSWKRSSTPKPDSMVSILWVDWVSCGAESKL